METWMSSAARLDAQEMIFHDALLAIRTRRARVAVVGLGYVGLPLLRLFWKAGYPVVGFDCDGVKIERLNAGESYIKHIAPASIAEMLQGRFEATADMGRLGEAEAIVICVPTPLTEHKEPDMTYIVQTSREIRDRLRPGQLVVLESTTYPGTLREVVQPILEETGLRAGSDFFLAYSPEREDPGNPLHSAAHVPKVVGGLDPKSHELAVALYTPLVPEVVAVSRPEVAEACKILENTYRCVNIAMVNELKMLFDRMGIDVWEVIGAASTKPFGFQAFYPGPGLGGHCIPIDPYYLSWIARRYDFHTRFIELAGEINTLMPDYVVSRVLLALNAHGKSARGSSIGILGMAYKKDLDDTRESPSFALLKKLQDLGAQVSYNDPYIPRLPRTRQHAFDLTSQELTPEYLQELDCVLIATDHSCYDWKTVLRHARLIVDTRNAIREKGPGADKVWKA
jgi:UDP-N-acetyl-D-glucosamine dehydrogenase